MLEKLIRRPVMAVETIGQHLNQMVDDSRKWLDRIGLFRFTLTDEEGIFVLETAVPAKKLNWVPQGIYVSYHPEADKPFDVDIEYTIKGCYRYKNGDGEPDIQDVNTVASFDRLESAFMRVIGDWFLQGVEGHLEAAGEARMYADDQRLADEIAESIR